MCKHFIVWQGKDGQIFPLKSCLVCYAYVITVILLLWLSLQKSFTEERYLARSGQGSDTRHVESRILHPVQRHIHRLVATQTQQSPRALISVEVAMLFSGLAGRGVVISVNKAGRQNYRYLEAIFELEFAELSKTTRF